MTEIDSLITRAALQSEIFLQSHVSQSNGGQGAISGAFALHTGQSMPDLYGMVDAVYILYIIGRLGERTDRASRRTWAERILSCQDEEGWFSKRNLRGHSREHATAYAIGALRLLEIEPDEAHVNRLRPLAGLLPLLTEHGTFRRWIARLGFRIALDDVPGNLGWNYVWRSSHVAGGVAAAVGMTKHLFSSWWGGRVDVSRWFDWFFEWLDAHINPKTGYWQRALWNLVYRKPNVIDLGGAAHFFWIYQASGRPFPYPEQTIRSTLAVQKETGLYRSYPMCIDLDGNFCLTRSFAQLSRERQGLYRESVHRALDANFIGIVDALTAKPLTEIYSDLHGLPGALTALVECGKLPGFRFADAIEDWRNPFDRAWWL
jgi:hypothetical protein